IAKLHLIFETMVNFKGVYFFDEFDSIGSHRNIVNDVGEIKRVLNGFLSYIEQDNSNSLIIAATNLPQTLDNALFRRFDDIVEYKLPDLPQILEVIKRKLAGIKTDRSISYEALAQKALRLSYSEITRACNEAIKEMIINKKDILCKSDLVSFITERKAFHDSIK
ncbi:MAG: ATP-binding protein, partial [Tunicatimonas sp.]|uniref:AAA family ATPase n=1 Tax=Tunicatimonas sp. TaxID=1940096 RepID=UPI003C736032